jgi:predicted Fe-Mo cluster-binding NifX family protein
MKLAFAANHPYTATPMSETVCDSRYLLIYDTGNETWESIPNPFQGFHPQRTALPLARILKRRGVEAVIANQCNRLLCQELMKAKIPVAIGVTETIEEAAQKALQGEYLFGLTHFDPITGEGRLRFLYHLQCNTLDNKVLA